MEDNRTLYLIPRNVETRFQFFPGFGWVEIGAIVGGVLVGSIFYWLLGLFTHSVFRFLFFILFPGVTFFIFKPTPDGQNLFKILVWLKKWSLRKKRYLYSLKGD